MLDAPQAWWKNVRERPVFMLLPPILTFCVLCALGVYGKDACRTSGNEGNGRQLLFWWHGTWHMKWPFCILISAPIAAALQVSWPELTTLRTT